MVRASGSRARGTCGVPEQGCPPRALTPVPHRENSLNDCRIIFVDEVFKIERPGEGGPVAEHPLRSEWGSRLRLSRRGGVGCCGRRAPCAG